jgi:hypothetical protein
MMPYIRQEERKCIDWATSGINCTNSGQLNYAITRLILNYLEDQKTRRLGETIKYQDLNDVLGALEGAKLEFYRRFCAPFEDGKKDQNGDVY